MPFASIGLLDGSNLGILTAGLREIKRGPGRAIPTSAGDQELRGNCFEQEGQEFKSSLERKGLS
jgi:hypothetical protein